MSCTNLGRCHPHHNQKGGFYNTCFAIEETNTQGLISPKRLLKPKGFHKLAQDYSGDKWREIGLELRFY